MKSSLTQIYIHKFFIIVIKKMAFFSYEDVVGLWKDGKCIDWFPLCRKHKLLEKTRGRIQKNSRYFFKPRRGHKVQHWDQRNLCGLIKIIPSSGCPFVKF